MEVSKTEGQVRWQSANHLDWDLEVSGGLELQLKGHLIYFETVEPGHKMVGRLLGLVLGMNREEHVRETSADRHHPWDGVYISMHLGQ